MGRSSTFLLAIAVVVLWAASGPIFGWSDTWQLVINTATTIVTFLIVFVIQNTQTRDTQAMQLKLDELPGRNKLKAGSRLLVCWFPEIKIHPVLLWGAVKLVGSRRPVGKVGEARRFPRLVHKSRSIDIEELRFARNLYGAFPVKGLFALGWSVDLLIVVWVWLISLFGTERPFFVPSPAIRFPERAEGVKGPKR